MYFCLEPWIMGRSWCHHGIYGDQWGSTRRRPRAKRSVGAGAVRWGHWEIFDARHSRHGRPWDAIHLGPKEIQTRDIWWYYIWLVVWNMTFIVPNGWDDPIWRTHIFQRGRYTINQICIGMECILKHVKTSTSPFLRRKSLRKWDMSEIWMP